MTSSARQTLLSHGYASLGFGADRAVLALFDQTPGNEPAWRVVDLIGGTRFASREIVADDLLGSIPGHWQVTRVEAVDFKEHGDRIVVTGRIYCRPRTSWETEALPFAHIWTFRQDKVVSVRSYLDGVELRRIERLEAGVTEGSGQHAARR